MTEGVIKVRQIMEYPLKAEASTADAVLLQTGGLGGPYAYTTAYGLVVGALDFPGSQLGVGIPLPGDAIDTGVLATNILMPLGCTFGWNWYQTATGPAPLGPGAVAAICYAGSFFDFEVNFTSVMQLANDGSMLLPLDTLTVARAPAATFEVATKGYVDSGDSFLNDLITNGLNNIIDNSVWSFNGRIGNVSLLLADILGAGGAPINSPSFVGAPTAPTPPTSSDSDAIATTAWVTGAIVAAVNQVLSEVVVSFNGRYGAVTLTLGDITGAGGAPINSPNFTGSPRAPTPPGSDVSDRIATTEWVRDAIFDTDTGLIRELQVDISVSPPVNPRRGKLWWDLSKGRSGGALYIFVEDNDSAQWVVANRSEPGPPGRPGLAHDIPNDTVLGNIAGHEDEPQPLTRGELTRLIDTDVLLDELPVFTHDDKGLVPPPDYVPNLTRGDYLLCGDGVWRHALFELPNIPEFANNAAAALGGVPIGGIYHTAGVVHVRLPP